MDTQRVTRTRGAALLAALLAGLLGGCVTVEVPVGGGGGGGGAGGGTGAQPTASIPSGTYEGDPDLPDQAQPPSDVEREIEDRVFELANEARESEGAGRLERHEGLDDLARRWSQFLTAEGRELAHNPDLGELAPDGWSAVGENVGWIDEGGRFDPERVATQIHEGWMESPGHRENLLREGYTHLGVGVAHDPEHGYYLTQNFATY